MKLAFRHRASARVAQINVLSRNPRSQVFWHVAPPVPVFHREARGMQRLARQEKPLSEGRGPSRLDELEVAALVHVKFVADDRVPALREMHADLMHAAGLRE